LWNRVVWRQMGPAATLRWLRGLTWGADWAWPVPGLGQSQKVAPADGSQGSVYQGKDTNICIPHWITTLPHISHVGSVSVIGRAGDIFASLSNTAKLRSKRNQIASRQKTCHTASWLNSQCLGNTNIPHFKRKIFAFKTG
jgi:hypothetical protein